jgi:hypothetical protein
MRKLGLIALAAICLLTAGCWQSSGSLYGNAKTVQPFRTGKLVSSNPENPKDLSHSVLTRDAGDGYRLTNADKGTSDFGDAFALRFFALAGLPKDVFVFEAVSDDKCNPGDVCRPMTAKSARYYGLVRLTKTGAEVTSPDCDKTSAAARLPGVKAEDYGTCSFVSRASLETAVRAQAGQKWKINLTYRYE